MFIKIKAQSSDLENQYIKERDIFKKKRKGPKILLSCVLMVTIAGYFYYLNLVNPVENNPTSIASSEKQPNSETTDANQSLNSQETENQSTLITKAIASEDQQLETKLSFNTIGDPDQEQVKTIENNRQSETFASELLIENEEKDEIDFPATEQSEITAIETINKQTDTISVDSNADKEILDTTGQVVIDDENGVSQIKELVANDTDNNIPETSTIGEQLSEEELAQEKLAEVEISEQALAEANVDETKSEIFLVENLEEQIPPNENSTLNNEHELITTELEVGSDFNNSIDQTTDEIEIPQNINQEELVSRPTTEPLNNHITAEHDLVEGLTAPKNAEDTLSVRSATTNLEPHSNYQEELSTETSKENLLTNASDDITSTAQDTVEITQAFEVNDSSLAARTDNVNSENIPDTQVIKDSSTIKKISNIISNVFKRNNDRDSVGADVIEIDFSSASSTEGEQERVAVVNVTDSDEQPYGGDSIEKVSNTTDDDTNQVTIFEISRDEENEIVEEDKQEGNIASKAKGEEVLFEGVDSIAAIDVSTINELGKEIKETASEEPVTANDNDIQDSIENADEDLEIDSIQVAKIDDQSTEETTSTESEAIVNTTTDVLTNSDIDDEGESRINQSNITVKDLYDQLMGGDDQNNSTEINTALVNTSTSTAISSNEQHSKKITMQELYGQINDSTETTNQNTDIKEIELTDTNKTTKMSTIVSVIDAQEAESKVTVTIDPNNSLAMTDSVDSTIKLDSIEDVVINVEPESSSDSKTQAQAEPTVVASIKNTNLNHAVDNKGSTALMIAALNSDLQTVRELVEQGAEINKRNDWGWTALLNATIKGNSALVAYLLKHGASPHLADNDGRSPLMAAVLNNHPEVVKTLLNYKADVNKANRDGWSALSFAAWKGDARTVKYLLEADAFKNHRTIEGLTPLQLAQQGGHSEIVRLLNL